MILIKKTTVSSCIKTQGKNLEHRENTGKTQGISSSPERGHPVVYIPVDGSNRINVILMLKKTPRKK